MYKNTWKKNTVDRKNSSSKNTASKYKKNKGYYSNLLQNNNFLKREVINNQEEIRKKDKLLIVNKELRDKLHSVNLKYRVVTKQVRDLRQSQKNSLGLTDESLKEQIQYLYSYFSSLSLTGYFFSINKKKYISRQISELFSHNKKIHTTLRLYSIGLALKLWPNRYLQREYGILLFENGFEKFSFEVLNAIENKNFFNEEQQKLYDSLCKKHEKDKFIPSKQSMTGNEEPKKDRIPSRLNTDKKIKDLNIAVILDDFSYESFKPEANLLELRPESWHQDLESFNPDILFVESAWRGVDDSWGSKVSHNSSELRNIITWFNDKELPTYFWCKEDPPHYGTFLNTAANFDYIFTTDIDCVNKYKNDIGNNNVFLMPFAAQPKMHNPIQQFKRENGAVFAGAYYVKYSERSRDLENILSSIKDYMPLNIYDRYHGTDDKNFIFPEKYKNYIRGKLPFNKIDKAYKGYDISINLNSIKHSQTMFARRVFELISSNTLVVSNYSRGLSNIFGDLVISSDSGEEIINKIDSLRNTRHGIPKLKLAGLRNVLTSHTYKKRLEHALDVSGANYKKDDEKRIIILAKLRNAEEIEFFRRFKEDQTFKNTKLFLIYDQTNETFGNNEDSNLISQGEFKKVNFREDDFFAFLSCEHVYGCNYLLDLILATQYSSSGVIGKGAFFNCNDNAEIKMVNHDFTYQNSIPMKIDRCLFTNLQFINIKDSLSSSSDFCNVELTGLSIDPFNFCEFGSCHEVEKSTLQEHIFDIEDKAKSLKIHELEKLAGNEKSKHVEIKTSKDRTISPKDYFESLPPSKNDKVVYSLSSSGMDIESTLDDESHQYIYQTKLTHIKSFLGHKKIPFHLKCSSGLNIRFVILFFNAEKERISHVIFPANENHLIELPEGVEFIKTGLRIYGSGCATFKNLFLEKRPAEVLNILSKRENLLLTNNYPSYFDLYRNGFVHRRVLSYLNRGVNFDVMRLTNNLETTFHEFNSIEYISGPKEQLRNILSENSYKNIYVHFLNEDMWSVLKDFKNKIKIHIWIHGAEIQSYERRLFNYDNEASLHDAKIKSHQRLRFWKSVFKDAAEKVNFIFVSNIFMKEVQEDLKMTFSSSNFMVINNPVDTEFFSARKKSVDDRKKILSIRSFASRKYANDLNTKAIIELSKKPYFDDLEFLIIGDGKLFEEENEPLKSFVNVKLRKEYLTQEQISEIQQEYGIFLCPTRWDSQGVSRDEAMAAGLVPITNNVSAVPEFVDDTCAFSVNADSYMGIADAIDDLYHDGDKFLKMSKLAIKQVLDNRSVDKIARLELNLLRNCDD